MTLVPTASQTVGPFYHIGLTHLETDTVLTPDGHDAVTVRGRVLDGDGVAVPDYLIEVWQADSQGRYDREGSSGFGRVLPDDSGVFSFTTVVPGRVPSADEPTQAPHLAILVFMRGLLKPLRTRMYFPGESANDSDPALACVPEDRRATLVAHRANDTTLEWNIVLQGEHETVFFEW